MTGFDNMHNNNDDKFGNDRLDLLLKSALAPCDRPDAKTAAQLDLAVRRQLNRKKSVSLWWLPSALSTLGTLIVVLFFCSVFRYCLFTAPICALSIFSTMCAWGFTVTGLLRFNLKEASML